MAFSSSCHLRLYVSVMLGKTHLFINVLSRISTDSILILSITEFPPILFSCFFTGIVPSACSVVALIFLQFCNLRLKSLALFITVNGFSRSRRMVARISRNWRTKFHTRCPLTVLPVSVKASRPSIRGTVKADLSCVAAGFFP